MASILARAVVHDDASSGADAVRERRLGSDRQAAELQFKRKLARLRTENARLLRLLDMTPYRRVHWRRVKPGLFLGSWIHLARLPSPRHRGRRFDSSGVVRLPRYVRPGGRMRERGDQDGLRRSPEDGEKHESARPRPDRRGRSSREAGRLAGPKGAGRERPRAERGRRRGPGEFGFAPG
jgi:hypothetical protein